MSKSKGQFPGPTIDAERYDSCILCLMPRIMFNIFTKYCDDSATMINWEINFPEGQIFMALCHIMKSNMEYAGLHVFHVEVHILCYMYPINITGLTLNIIYIQSKTIQIMITVQPTSTTMHKRPAKYINHNCKSWPFTFWFHIAVYECWMKCGMNT